MAPKSHPETQILSVLLLCISRALYSIGHKSHPISWNLVMWPCLVSYKKVWGSVGSGWESSQLSGSSQPKRTRKEGTLEVINGLCHSLPASIQVPLLTLLPIGRHTYFPKETNQSPSNYCTQLRIQELWDRFSLPVSSDVDLVSPALKDELSATQSSVGKDRTRST